MPGNSPSTRHAEITVLAGVNGAGKSSIGGAFLRTSGAEYFNPDEVARSLMVATPGLSQMQANADAWQVGKRLLEAAIAGRTAFTFETTLGGKTITQLLIDAVAGGAAVQVWYAGLESVELHLKRVAARVAKGGHAIPAEDIRKRWHASHANIIRLIPHVTTLRIFDNSLERDPAKGTIPEPQLVLAIEKRRLVFPPPSRLKNTPQWAKPIVFAAYQHFGLGT